MNVQHTAWDDTIAALATPPGIGALGIIRLSGAQAISIANMLFPAKDLAAQPSHTLHVGLLKDGDRTLDQAVVSLYKAPHSFTGEDVVEFSCHGSPYILNEVLQACLQHGARLAKAGEFTQRAFLAGKLDLTQAEAVADVIASNAAAAHRAALTNMRGGFKNELQNLREQLLQFSSLIELELDFAEEDVAFADRTALQKLIATMAEKTSSLLLSFQWGNVIKNGVNVAIIGKPNAGKSTLLNALLNEARAIVSDLPGTTRDTIEEVLNIEGILFRLIDTAGIRSHTSDAVEQAGIEKSLQKMQLAELVLYVFDAVEMDAESLQQEIKNLLANASDVLLVANKTDAGDEAELKEKFAGFKGAVYISAANGQNIIALKQAMAARFLQQVAPGEAVVVTNIRHYEALKKLSEAVSDVMNGLKNGLPGDLLSLDIRRCLHFLGTITGEITNEDQLDYIFSKFCIGK